MCIEHISCMFCCTKKHQTDETRCHPMAMYSFWWVKETYTPGISGHKNVSNVTGPFCPNVSHVYHGFLGRAGGDCLAGLHFEESGRAPWSERSDATNRAAPTVSAGHSRCPLLGSDAWFMVQSSRFFLFFSSDPTFPRVRVAQQVLCIFLEHSKASMKQDL